MLLLKKKDESVHPGVHHRAGHMMLSQSRSHDALSGLRISQMSEWQGDRKVSEVKLTLVLIVYVDSELVFGVQLPLLLINGLSRKLQ